MPIADPPYCPGFLWDHAAEAFLGSLIERDARYLDPQHAIEHVLGPVTRNPNLLARVATSWIKDGHRVFVHRVPPYFIGMAPLWVAFTIYPNVTRVLVIFESYSRR